MIHKECIYWWWSISTHIQWEVALTVFEDLFSGPHLFRPEFVCWRSCCFLSEHNFYFAASVTSVSCSVGDPEFCFFLPFFITVLTLTHSSLWPHLGDIQSCRCPVGWNRLALPVPERLLRPAGPWQRLPYAHRRRTCTHWNVNVLLLRHSACTGMNPQGDQWDSASLVVWQMIFSALLSRELLVELVFFAAFTPVEVTMDPCYWLCRALYWEVMPRLTEAPVSLEAVSHPQRLWSL